MNNMFNDQDPCLHFMQDDSAQSNSLLGNIIIKDSPKMRGGDFGMFGSNSQSNFRGQTYHNDGNFRDYDGFDRDDQFSGRGDNQESSEYIVKKEEDMKDQYVEIKRYQTKRQAVDSQQELLKNENGFTRIRRSDHKDIKTEQKNRSSKPKNTNPKSKERKKVFYRDKMAELMSQDGYVKPQYNYVDFTAHQQEDRIPISRDEQLKRNRESAKQSRQRKKEYVETLQEKNRQYQKTISDLTQRLRQKQLELQRLKESSNHHLQSFIEMRAANYEKLSRVVNSSASEEEVNSLNITPKQKEKVLDQLNRDKSSLAMVGLGGNNSQNSMSGDSNKSDQHSPSLDHLTYIQACLNEQREKFGSSGCERVRTINYYMEEIIENSIPDIHKYFINCALEKAGLFSENASHSEFGETRIEVEINEILGMNLEKRRVLIQKYRDTFNRQASLFSEISKRLYQTFNCLINQSSILEKIFYDMSSHFNPYQIGSLFLYFEENKFRKDHKKVKNSWYEGFLKKEDEVVDEIRKMTKTYRYQ